MDRVARTREPIVITKRGRPVAKLVPPDEVRTDAPLFGYMAGSAEIRGDIVHSPQPAWSAMSGEEDELYADLGPLESASVVREPRRRYRRK
jgi:antitoxin (DNA-binding transcriptional repressor) of toxin-antitoxin stability system